MGGSMQVVQLSLQAATEAAKLIDLLGQINPSFAPLAQLLIEQMRNGLKSTLQQGMASSEPTGPMPPASMGQQGPMPQAAPIPGASQQPLPPMGAGFGQ